MDFLIKSSNDLTNGALRRPNGGRQQPLSSIPVRKDLDIRHVRTTELFKVEGNQNGFGTKLIYGIVETPI